MNTPVTLLTSIVERRETLSGGGEAVRFNPAGEPHARAMVDAVAGHYHRITSRPRPALSQLRELTGIRVTIAYTSRNLYGGSFIEAREGTLMPAGRYYPDYRSYPDDSGHSADSPGSDQDTRLVLRPAGNRSHAIALDAGDVLDIERGYGHLDTLRGLVALCQTRLPRLQPLTREHLLTLPSYNTGPSTDTDAGEPDGADDSTDQTPAFIRLAVMGTWRGPDGDCPAAIWLLDSYDPIDDIAEGYLLVSRDRGYSEHGSFYGRLLLGFGGLITLPATGPGAPSATMGTGDAGEVITTPEGTPMTLADAFALGEKSQEQWLAYFTR